MLKNYFSEISLILLFLTSLYLLSSVVGYSGGGFILSIAVIICYGLSTYKLFTFFKKEKNKKLKDALKLLTVFTLLIGAGDIGWHTLHYLDFFKNKELLVNITMHSLFITGYIVGIIAIDRLTYYRAEQKIRKYLLTIPFALTTLTFFVFLAFIPEGKEYNLINTLNVTHVFFGFYLFFTCLLTFLSSRNITWSFYLAALSIMFLNGTEVVALSYTGMSAEFGLYEFIWAFGVLLSTLALVRCKELGLIKSFEAQSLLTHIRLFSLFSTVITIVLVLFSLPNEDFIIKLSAIGMTSGVLIATFFSHFIFQKILNYRKGLSDLLELGIRDINKITENSMHFELQNSYEEVLRDRLSQLSHKVEIEKELVVAKIASQMAHDVRSPIAALEVLLSTANEIPKENRLLVTKAIQRIKDIANNLLNKKRILRDSHIENINENSTKDPLLVSSLVENIISEKRVSINQDTTRQITIDFSPAQYGIFTNFNSLELGRILSNLIDNAIDSISGNGRIDITLSALKSDKILLCVKDTGCGIPGHIISELGSKPLSYGKKDGNGLGIYHASNVLKNNSGKLLIESDETGTKASIIIDKTRTPQWFLNEININEKDLVVILDDDPCIHKAWQNKLKNSNIELIHFLNSWDFSKWINNNGKKTLSPLFLMDYELIGEELTGLDLIRKFGIEKDSILVTSHFEESPIIQTSLELGVKILPKPLFNKTPTSINYHHNEIQDSPMQ